ncbi:MAG: cystathionine beta-lyase [bacterium]
MKDETLLAHAGRDPEKHFGIVNPPTYRASTILYPSLDAYKKRFERRYDWFSYGIHGTPTTFALTEAMAQLEGGERSIAFSSGLAAITLPLTALLRPGDHLLLCDSVYGPTRNFAEGVLARFGVETSYYDPLAGAEVAGLMRERTRVVFVESPGSLTFEVQDIPAIAAAAHRGGALVMMDNTWATPLFFRPFDHGVDISIHAATKYIGGHSDLLLGLLTVKDIALFRQIKDGVGAFGDCVAPDVCSLALRGLRTLAVRLYEHQRAGIEIAHWLAARPEVKRVLHPALPEDPGHQLWKRDFLGASGLFGVVLHTASEAAVAAMIDELRWFKIGSSWGGYESLITPALLGVRRTAVPWSEEGYLLRISVGLEAVEDLIADLDAGLERLNRALADQGQ